MITRVLRKFIINTKNIGNSMLMSQKKIVNRCKLKLKPDQRKRGGTVMNKELSIFLRLQSKTS